MTVLLTGFAPFAGASVNSSWLAVTEVARRWKDPEQLRIAELPVEFAAASERMDELIDLHEPELVIATGLAAGRAAVTPERVAINIDDARIADNAGDSPIDMAIVEGGPAAYFSTLPIKAIVDRIDGAGIPAQVSQTAGTFVCNHVFYRLMHSAHARGDLRAGFVHVPLATEFPGDLADFVQFSERREASMPLADIAAALTLAVRTSLDIGIDGRIDAPIAGGSLH